MVIINIIAITIVTIKIKLLSFCLVENTVCSLNEIKSEPQL